MKTKECMCNQVIWCKPENTVYDCAKLMAENHIGCVPVCDNENEVVGLVTDRDIILRSVCCEKNAKTTKISEIMSTNVCSCSPESDIKHVEKLMSDNQVRRLPVIENNKIVGIVTLADLAKNPNVSDSCVCNTVENICGCNEKNAQ